MSAQQFVDPSQIETQLIQVWEALAKEKMRACLFNLIVYNELSARTDYIRKIVQRVSEKYPCRVLFISFDPKAAAPYLKTAVSIVGSGTIACDYIDIGVAGVERERVPFLLRSHLIPDLPISLLWTEDPIQSNSFFSAISKLSSRIIFDSETADNLLSFSSKVLDLKQSTRVDYADLNWARIEGWRDLIVSTFDTLDRLPLLKEFTEIKITYNSRPTEFFCHLKIQSMYLLAWLSSRLGWKFQKSSPNLTFQFEKQTATIIQDETWEKVGPGSIVAISFQTKDGHKFECCRDREATHRVQIQISSPEKCELPYQFLLGQAVASPSLIKEIITKGTSPHYLDMLKEMNQLDRDRLC